MNKSKQFSDSQQPNENPNQTKLKFPLPKKFTSSQLDDIRTKSLKSRDVFKEICDKILEQKPKLQKDILYKQKKAQQQLEDDDLMVYDPHYKVGKIQDYRDTTEQQKKALGLQDQGKCQHFTLNGQYFVVLIGRLPVPYQNGIQISLYLPRSMIQGKQPTYQNKQVVIIKRHTINPDPNFLNYPTIILEPHQLLYPSYICSWIQCKRRISLVNYITSEFQVNQHLVFGSACHRYMEWLLDGVVSVDVHSFVAYKEIGRKIYDSFMYDMYLVNATFEHFWKYCEQSLSNIRLWVKNHIQLKRQIQVNKYKKLYLIITQVIGSQTMHRSKYFGLKGKTDGLFKGILHNKTNGTKTQVFIPFELKTGKKVSQSHKRQTDIYNLLLREKQKKPVIGLLYYSQTNQSIFREESSQIAFQTIVIHRNTILMNLMKLYKGQKIQLPNLLTNLDQCKMCQKAVECELFFIGDRMQSKKKNVWKKKYGEILPKAKNQPQAISQPVPLPQSSELDQQEKPSHSQQILPAPQSNQPNKNLKAIQDLFDSSSEQQDKEEIPSSKNQKSKKKLQALSGGEVRYILKWMRWLHFEERQTRQAIQKSIQKGYNNFVLNRTQLHKLKTHFNTVDPEKKLKFIIKKNINSTDEYHALSAYYQPSQKMRIIMQHLGIMEGCKIIFTKKHHTCFEMQVQLNNTEVAMNRRALEYSIQNKVDHDVELEKFESLQLAGLRNTIMDFVSGPNEKLKSLVIQNYEFKKTTYEAKNVPKQIQVQPMNSSQHINEVAQQQNGIQQHKEDQKSFPIIINQSDFSTLNSNQRQAFTKVFTSEYLTLVQGMPGTGKTQLIIRIIQKCYSLNQKILITTFTNRSLDNIIERIFKSTGIPAESIIREGSRYSMDERFEKLNSRSQKFATVQDYQNYFNSKNIWFVTLASINIHHVPKMFDLIILDQASQCLQPACIQALSRGKKIVMIGDYKQLQPIVKSRKAANQGMDISLFQRLCSKYPQETVSLKLQYRMNSQIMKLSNTLVYDDLLEVGSDEVAKKIIHLEESWKQTCNNEETLISVIEPQNSVIFLNHDGLTSALSALHRQRINDITHVLEVQIASYLFNKLMQLGLSQKEMTIVCVYNKTVDVVTGLLKKMHHKAYPQKHWKNQGQVLTIDKSQGIDKQVIILLAQSRQESKNILLENCRRLNVALTRAKSKLIIIGSMKYLQQMQAWNGKLSKLLYKSMYDITKKLIDHIIVEVHKADQFQEKKVEENPANEIQMQKQNLVKEEDEDDEVKEVEM